MSDAFKIGPLPGNFGVEIRDINIPELTDDDLRALLMALYANRIGVVRTPGLTRAQYVHFARRVGDPLLIPGKPAFPEIIPIDNLGVDTQETGRGAAHWHTDQSFTRPLASVTMLYSVKAPGSGGETRFVDMAAAWQALPRKRKTALADLIVEHRHGVSIVARPGDHTPIAPGNWDQSRTVTHPLVRRHPITGEQTLYAITGTSQGIVGMGPEEARALLTELCEHAFQPRFLTSHQHRPGDILMWDNPTTMHSASPIAAATCDEDTRIIRRISLRGTPSVFFRY
jgi:taurine dioxygenase